MTMIVAIAWILYFICFGGWALQVYLLFSKHSNKYSEKTLVIRMWLWLVAGFIVKAFLQYVLH